MAKRTKAYTLEPGRLWPNTPSGAKIEIDVIVGTGEHNTGKSLFGHQIAPGVHPEGHPFAGQPRTTVFDLEKSNCTFSGTGAERIDVPTELLGVYGDKPYGPLETLHWIMKKVESYKPGQRDVFMFDPGNELEDGITEYVRRYPDKFNMTPEQIRKAGGLFWGAMKAMWKQVLLKFSARCKCVYSTTHLRDVWAGNSPVAGKREPKGKDTLFELATLYLWFEREQVDNAVPSAIVLKQRLADTWIDQETGELQIVDLLPPRLPIATIPAIRGYIASPPDRSKLKEDEKYFEKGLTDDDRLRLQAQIAENQKQAEESRLTQLQRQAELRAMANRAASEAPQAPDRTAQVHADKADKAKADADAAKEAERRKKEDEELARMKEKAAEGLKKTAEETARLCKDNDMAGQKKDEPAAGQTQTISTTEASTEDAAGDKATKSQVNEAKANYTKLAAPDANRPGMVLTQERFAQMVTVWGASKVSELTREKAHQFNEFLVTLYMIRSVVVDMASIGGDKALATMLERVKVPDIFGLSADLAVKLLQKFEAEKAKRLGKN
jgi:hypothetical protein